MVKEGIGFDELDRRDGDVVAVGGEEPSPSSSFFCWVGGRGRRLSGRGKGGAAVEVDAALALAPRSDRGRDMDSALDWLQELPKRRRRVMAQHRALSAGKRRRHPTSMPARRAVSYGVDAAVEAMQLPSTHLSRDRFRSDAGRFELSSRHGSMLPRCDRGDPRMCRVAFCIHTDA